MFAKKRQIQIKRSILMFLIHHRLYAIFMSLHGWLKLENIKTLLKTKNKIKCYLRENTTKKLNIGCSRSHLIGWLNADIKYGDIYLNATKDFPFDNNTFDYIYSEHFIQQVTLSHAKFFLKESFRILKPNGVLRITTPDLEYHVKLYLGLCNEIDLADYSARLSVYYDKAPSKCEFLNDYMILFGKQFNYDFELLSKICKDIGFCNIKRMEYAVSEHVDLQKIESHSKSEWVNKYATFHLEGTKL